MDTKLLLAIQYQCNLAGLAVPYTEIGKIMGEGITGGAVIQHLAKLRLRLIALGHSVPPPLRRGGGSARVSTSASTGSKAKAVPANDGNSQVTATSTKSNPAKPKKKAGKKAALSSDESEEEEDSSSDDSDADYGEHRAKRAKFGVKGPMRRNLKMEDTDGEASIPSNPPKRKHQSSKSSSRELSAYGTTDINGVPIDYDSHSEDEDDTKAELVAAGAPWLDLEDDYPSHAKTGKKSLYKKKSLVVSLPTTSRNAGMLEGIGEEVFGDMIEDKSEDEVVGGGIESCVDDSHILSSEDVGQAFPNPLHGTFENQIEPASGFINHDGMYNNAYHAGPQIMSSNGGMYQDRQTLVNAFNNFKNSSTFQASDDLFDNGGVIQTPATERFQSGNFDFGQISTNFNGQSAGGFGDFNGGFGGDFQNNGGVGMSNGIVQQGAFAYQIGNAYGASPNGFGSNAGGHTLSHDHQHPNPIPFPIQTSWPSNHSTAGASHETSVNQTPAGTSAGVDVGTGYFGNGYSDLGSFDNANIDFSANDGADGFFNAGHFDGNFIGNGFHGSNPYGN